MRHDMTTGGVTALTHCIEQLMNQLGEADRQLASREKASLEKRDILIRARDILWDGGAVSSLVSEQSLAELAAQRMNQLYDAKRTVNDQKQTIKQLTEENKSLHETLDRTEARINKVLTLLKGITNPLAADVREALAASTDEQKEENK